MKRMNETDNIFTENFVNSLAQNIDGLGLKDSIHSQTLKNLAKDITEFICNIYYAKDTQNIPVCVTESNKDNYKLSCALKWLKDDNIMNWSRHKLKQLEKEITNGIIYPEYIGYNCPELLLAGKKLVRDILGQFFCLFSVQNKNKTLMNLLCLGCRFYTLKNELSWTGTSYLFGAANTRVTNKRKTGAENKAIAEKELTRLFEEDFYPDWEAGEYDGKQGYLETIEMIKEDYKDWADSSGKPLGTKRIKKLYSMANEKRQRKKCV